MSNNTINRPPIGFIVEGLGEYNTYPSLFSRIVGKSNLHIPRINSGGYGGITSNLKEQLNDITFLHHPYAIIITLDLIDVLKANLFTDCVELHTHLFRQSNEWLSDARLDNRMNPLPEYIQIVIQIQKFESWMISDIPGLITAGFLAHSLTQIKDVDNSVQDPYTWLKENSLKTLNPKNLEQAKIIISSLNPAYMKTNSNSFDKFFREVQRLYNLWEAAAEEEV